jgi:hypothetical protein
LPIIAAAYRQIAGISFSKGKRGLRNKGRDNKIAFDTGNEKRSYHDHLIVFGKAVHIDSVSGTKGSMRRIGKREKKIAADPKRQDVF